MEWIGVVMIAFIVLTVVSPLLAKGLRWLAEPRSDPDYPERWCRSCREWTTHKRYIRRQGAPFSGMSHDWGYNCLVCPSSVGGVRTEEED